MKTKHIVAVLLMCLSVAFLGAIAFAQPPSYTLEKERGSWWNEHWRQIVSGAEAQMVTLMNHDVDAGGPPTPDDIPTLIGAGYMMASTGGFSHYWYALNMRVEPLNDPVFREALAYCMDKDTIFPTLYGPLVTAIYNWAPPAQAFWCNPDVDDAFPRFNLQTAIDTLVGGGYTPVDAGNNPVANPQVGNIDHWHMPGTTTNIRDLEQQVPNTSTLGMQVSQWVESDLHSIGLPIYHTPLPFGYIVYQCWLAPPYLNWDMTYGIGLLFGVDPVMDLMYHSDSIPFANIWGLEDAQVDAYIEASMQTLDWEVAKQNVWDCQTLLSEIMPMIPMITSQTWTCATGPYNGQPGVLGWVNSVGYGGINDWSRLYGRRELSDDSPMDVQNWIMGQDADVLNPLVSDTAYEWALMARIYDGLYIRHPYTHILMPWAADGPPVIELWNGTHIADKNDPDFNSPTYDPSPVGSPGAVVGEKMTWTIRTDMTWHSGEPVTTQDIELCLDLLVRQNNERYDFIHKYIHDVNVLDTYNFEVYFTARYLWADNDVAGISLLTPYHVWKPYIAGADNTLWTGDDRDHRFWTGHEWTNNYGYSAPSVATPIGNVQLTHLIGSGYCVYQYGDWSPGVSMRMIRDGGNTWHYNRILRGDNNFDGIADVLDLWAALFAFGTQPGMPKWRFEADMANPSGYITGDDVAKVYDDWGYYWYPSSTLP